MAAETVAVSIGIQARTDSDRLPGKVNLDLGGKPVLERVIDAAKRSALYLNRKSHVTGIKVDVYLLTPVGDELVARYRSRVQVIEGPHLDVLARYMELVSLAQPDYVVRITGDCPLIPPFVITKHIQTAVNQKYDYFSNVEPAVRTAIDGFDCEVISRRLIEYGHAQAVSADEREHVTLFLRRRRPEWATYGAMIDYLDLSKVHLSLDTIEDYERIRAQWDSIERKTRRARDLYGEKNVHRF